MADIISCPFCPRKLQVPLEVLGRQVQCPGCGKSFMASAAESRALEPHAAPAELHEHVSESQTAAIAASIHTSSTGDEPSTPTSLLEGFSRESGSLADWRNIQNGVGLLYHGLVIGCVTIMSTMCAGVGFSATRNSGAEEAAIGTIAIGLLLLGGLTSVTMHLVGLVFCLRSPLEQQAQTLTRISLTLLLVGLGIVLIGSTFGLAGNYYRPFLPLGDLGVSLGWLVVQAQSIILLLYLQALALNLRQQQIAQSFRQLAWLAGGIVASLIAFIGANLAGKLSSGSGDWSTLVGVLSACPIIILTPIFLALYGALLSTLRGAVGVYVLRRERQA